MRFDTDWKKNEAGFWVLKHNGYGGCYRANRRIGGWDVILYLKQGFADCPRWVEYKRKRFGTPEAARRYIEKFVQNEV